MYISIGIPTWNRANILKRTLERLASIRVPEGVSWEVLVVDNNSTDETQNVIKAFEIRLPLRGLFQNRQGRSWALNRALEMAKGEYIIWIDDDILVDIDWLIEYRRAFFTYPDTGVFGGKIEPRFEGNCPIWLGDALAVVGGVYGKCDPLEGIITTNDPFLPFGGNMAVQADLQRKFPFDVRLGRQKGQMLAGEEADSVRKMLEAGFKGRWLPKAHVEHIIPEECLTLSHIRRYFHDWGVSVAMQQFNEGSTMLWNRPRWAWRQAIQSEFRYHTGRLLRRSPRIWIQDLRLASFAWGILRRHPMRLPEVKQI